MPKHLHYESETQLERCNTIPPQAVTSSDVLMMTVESAGSHTADQSFSEVVDWARSQVPYGFTVLFSRSSNHLVTICACCRLGVKVNTHLDPNHY